ncbi:MAG: hypothetical protein P1V20_15450 [Verrucomicrobiales bacterium]|nr:hypothetical protein [Verrucomicrobiales bacterium]
MYPDAIDPTKVGDYPAVAGAGGGYVWDEVLEYRVWCHPKDGSEDFYYTFATYDEACLAAKSLRDTDDSIALVEEPLALILQKEHINEQEPGVFEHVTTRRIAEWAPEFLSRPRRTEQTIPDFFAPDAPDNRLDIIRGLAKPLPVAPKPLQPDDCD